ncbi:MAG: hypothetical protein M3259_11400 [Actinomycetota bacterium]|nr:hypothetical protein [Actinomycetota bacterium]
MVVIVQKLGGLAFLGQDLAQLGAKRDQSDLARASTQTRSAIVVVRVICATSLLGSFVARS